MHKMYKFHLYQVNSHKAIVDAMKVKRSIYFATLQGYVIFETELYIVVHSIWPPISAIPFINESCNVGPIYAILWRL